MNDQRDTTGGIERPNNVAPADVSLSLSAAGINEGGRTALSGCFTDPGDAVAAAYDAPFPSEASKAGARAFPAILPATLTLLEQKHGTEDAVHDTRGAVLGAIGLVPFAVVAAVCFGRLIAAFVVALASLAPEKALPVLLEALADPEARTRFTAAEGLLGLDPSAPGVDALLAKARGVVRVRVIYDWMGGFGKTSRRFWNRLRAGGVEVRCYNPPRLEAGFPPSRQLPQGRADVFPQLWKVIVDKWRSLTKNAVRSQPPPQMGSAPAPRSWSEPGRTSPRRRSRCG